MIQRVKVSSKNQIAVPSDIRKKLGIKPGDHLLIQIQGDLIVLGREPVDHVAAMRGLGREIWADIDVREYIRGERETCPDSQPRSVPAPESASTRESDANCRDRHA